MCVVMAAVDESAGQVGGGWFYYCGLIGPEADWRTYFVPAWEQRILSSPPSIPYLHMTEIRSRAWRRRHGLAEWHGDQKIEEAMRVIFSIGSLYPVAVRVDAGRFGGAFKGIKVITPNAPGVAPFNFEADYFCFIAFAFSALRAARQRHPDCTRVDFVVEEKMRISERLPHFHEAITAGLAALGHPEYGPLVGELRIGTKRDSALQAADVLCWFTQRPEQHRLTSVERRQLHGLATRNGFRWDVPPDEIGAFAERAHHSPSAFVNRRWVGTGRPLGTDRRRS